MLRASLRCFALLRIPLIALQHFALPQVACIASRWLALLGFSFGFIRMVIRFKHAQLYFLTGLVQLYLRTGIATGVAYQLMRQFMVIFANVLPPLASNDTSALPELRGPTGRLRQVDSQAKCMLVKNVYEDCLCPMQGRHATPCMLALAYLAT